MSRRFYTSLLVTALLALILTACSSAPEPTPVPTPDATEAAQRAEQAIEIRDTTWTVKHFGGPEETIPGVDGTYPSIEFLLSRATGYTGCNYFTGGFTVDGNTVRFDPPAVTRGFCEDELLKQQQDAFLTRLITTTRFDYDGENIHLYADDTLLMTLEALEPVPFEGTTWNYRFYQGELPQWQPVMPDTSITAVFEGDTISGSAGCNDYTGTVTRDDDKITIAELITERETCAEPEGIMDQEDRYLAALQSAVSIRESARSIELFDADKPIMLFNAD